MKSPDKNSGRSKRRKNRGFQSLELSCRIHRRAKRRLDESRTIGNNHMGGNGKLYDSGARVEPPNDGKEKTFLQRAGGAVNYH